MRTVPLTELAAVIRSKNAGPYELTLDIMFKREADYLFLKNAGFFTRELFARLYGIAPDQVLNVVHFDPAAAVKATLVRPLVSGALGDTDIYGAQQHAPLWPFKCLRPVAGPEPARSNGFSTTGTIEIGDVPP